MCYSHAGLATHYIPSHRLDDVLESLAEGLIELPLNNPSATSKTIDSLLNQFRGDLEPYTLAPIQETIDRAFLAPNLNTVISRLREFIWSEDKNISSWAQETLNLFINPTESSSAALLSPTALHTTFSLLQKGSTSTLKTALRTEIALAQNYFEKVDDLYTGIDAKLIQKHGIPLWNPSKLDQVDPFFIKSLFEKPDDPIISKFKLLITFFIL